VIIELNEVLIIGKKKQAPAEALIDFSLNGSAQAPVNATASHPNPCAVLNKVPTFPGSLTLSMISNSEILLGHCCKLEYMLGISNSAIKVFEETSFKLVILSSIY